MLRSDPFGRCHLIVGVGVRCLRRAHGSQSDCAVARTGRFGADPTQNSYPRCPTSLVSSSIAFGRCFVANGYVRLSADPEAVQ